MFLIGFMFLIGLELDPKYLKTQINVAILTFHLGILVPFSLGTLLALLLYPLEQTSLALDCQSIVGHIAN